MARHNDSHAGPEASDPLGEAPYRLGEATHPLGALPDRLGEARSHADEALYRPEETGHRLGEVL